jgi:glycerophosphoryl diester phosphodiesterase
VPRVSGLIKVGHKGADHVAPGNTIASFEAALECGVDMIEFDVLRLKDGRLVLAHDYEDGRRPDALTLEEGLDHFAGEAYGDIEIDVDLKLPGYEAEVVEGLLSRGLDGRALISSHYLESLDRIAELAPGVRRGWSVPKVKRDYTKSYVTAVPAYALLQILRARMPGQAARVIGEGRAEALMANRLLVTRRLVRAVHEAGGLLYVWTVDDAKQIARLEALGADAVITNDPRLFHA